ncbi:hypothetical protein [Luteolibacter sp. AS25]|uniref:hypothetical protein n=1 Tax=Luteolibacter sp. AS25 TaxID=3135776 RepID=UPI00398AAFDA
MFDLNFIACSTCRVNFSGSDSDAAGYSIFALLVVILAVLGAVGFFMIRMARRENDNLDPELRDDYVSH